MAWAIRVDNLGKCLPILREGPGERFPAAALRRLRAGKGADERWVLRGVSLSLPQGAAVGVIGANGSGKSTLLRLLGGVGRPDEGTVEVSGRIAGLLDLAAGMHPDLTGRENAVMGSLVAGFTEAEARAGLSQVFDFAEMGEYADEPLRAYSAGMQMRLAFSVMLHGRPDVLLVDEHLSVGDLSFRKKCLRRILQLKERGCSIVLATHDLNQMQQLCDRAIWLRQGVVAAEGDAREVATRFGAHHGLPPRSSPSTERNRPQPEFRSGLLELTDAELRPNRTIQSGEPLAIGIGYRRLDPDISEAHFSVRITGQQRSVFLAYNTALGGCSPSITDRGRVWLHLERVDLVGGDYFVDIGAHEHSWSYAYDYHWHRYPLQIESPAGSTGIICPPARWEVSAESGPADASDACPPTRTLDPTVADTAEDEGEKSSSER